VSYTATVRVAPSGAGARRSARKGSCATEGIRRLTAMGCRRARPFSPAASVAGPEGSSFFVGRFGGPVEGLPFPDCRFGGSCRTLRPSPVCALRRADTETRRRPVSRLQGDCIGNDAVEATAVRSARNAPLPEPTVHAVALGHRLNAWDSLRSFLREARSPRHTCGGEPLFGAVAEYNVRTPLAAREPPMSVR
jgi:hypothetical protein